MLDIDPQDNILAIAARHTVDVVTVGILKGGAIKTTTAMHAGFYYHAQGWDVLLVDGDPQSQGASDWRDLLMESTGQELPFDLRTWPHPRSIRDELPRYIEAWKRNRPVGKRLKVIIDTGGENPDVFRAAADQSDKLLIPCAPTKPEVRRLPATLEEATMIAQARSATGQDRPLYASILFAKIDRRTGEEGTARAMTTELPVLEQGIGIWAQYKDAWGTVVTNFGEFKAAFEELDAA